MRIIRQISLAVQVIIFLCLCAAVGYGISVKLNLVPIVKPYIVLSGSMSPSIKTGSVIISLPKTNYSIGDIVTFKSGSKEFITHRIINKILDKNLIKYQTKGDANNHPDQLLLDPNTVLGKTILTIPYLGFAANFAKTPKGFILLVIVPATIIVYEEMRTIMIEIKKALQKFTQQTNDSRKVNRWYIAVPALASLVVFIGITGSYFLDQETSQENILGAAASFGPPTPTPTATPTITPTPTPNPIANYLLIQEVYINPDKAHQINGQGGDNRGEWIELYNPTANSINLTGYHLVVNGNTLDLPVISVNAQQTLIISGASKSEFEAVWNPVINFYQTSGGKIATGLAEGGGNIRLQNGTTDIDALSYGSDIGVLNPSIPTPSDGHSLNRDPAGKDTHQASDFIDDSSPSPGNP